MFHAPSLTCQCRTRSTRPICSFYHMPAGPVAEKPTNMPSPWWMWPAATRRLSLRLARDALEKIYKRSPLGWPKLLQVDPGHEFMGAVSQLLANHNVSIRRGRVDIHRDQGIVKGFNRTLAERLFGHQYAQEMRLPEGERSTKWVAWLPAVIAAVNSKETRLTGKKPKDVIKFKRVAQKPSSVYHRPLELDEQKLLSGVGVCFLYQPGELEGGRHRATDPVWSLGMYRLARVVTISGAPVVYYLEDGPQRRFVREELLVVPSDTQQTPSRLSWHSI